MFTESFINAPYFLSKPSLKLTERDGFAALVSSPGAQQPCRAIVFVFSQIQNIN